MSYLVNRQIEKIAFLFSRRKKSIPSSKIKYPINAPGFTFPLTKKDCDEIPSSKIGIPPRYLPKNLKNYKVLDSVGDGHLYLIKAGKKHYVVDNLNYWDTNDPKSIKIKPTKAKTFQEYFKQYGGS